jgi:hypothetical protein
MVTAGCCDSTILALSEYATIFSVINFLHEIVIEIQCYMSHDSGMRNAVMVRFPAVVFLSYP